MALLKKKKNDSFKLEIKSIEQGEKAPWVTLFQFMYDADRRGEAVGTILLAECKTKTEVMVELGRHIVENSTAIRTWMKKQGVLEDE